MAYQIYAGSTSQTVRFFIQDTSVTTGAGLTGLTHSTSGLTAYYSKGGTGAATQITLASQTATGAWTSGGFCAVGATGMAGLYRLDLPNAAVDTEAEVIVMLMGAANMAPVAIRITCHKLQANAVTVADKTGYSLTAGTGLGNQTSNITGSLSGSVGSISGVTFPGNFDKTEIAANGHVSAAVKDIANNAITASSIQGGAITAAKFEANAITESALAADAVSKIQSGLATSANQTIIIDRVSYSLTALVGACSDAGTAAETYTLSIGGSTFTVDHSGLDATGNRGAVTLSKV